MKGAIRALALILAVLGPTATAQQVPLIPDAMAAEAKAAMDAVKALDPPSISRMSGADAVSVLRRLRVAQLQVTQTLALALGERMNEERFKAELAASGIGEMFTEPFQQRVKPIEGKLSPQETRALERELGSRFPAYGNYVKRAVFAGVFVELLPLRPAIDQQYITTSQMPASIDESRLQALRAKRGVQGASYANGVFRVVLDDEIAEGGMFEYYASPKADGTLEWRCTSSANVRPFAPERCRQ